jgi:signal transduction histidine kinase/CheY-like chemotaxis protein
MLRGFGSAQAAYGLAVAAIAITTAARVALDPLLGQSLYYTLYFPAVALVAFTGRLGASLLTTVASAIVANYLFVAPRYQLALVTVNDLVAVVAFLAAGALIAILADRLYRQQQDLLVAVRTVSDRNDALEKERAKLEREIASRRELSLENARLLVNAERDAEEARRARADAEEASRVKDEFLGTLSHELRTPLNAIVGWAHMLRDPALSEDRRRAAIETIVRNAQSQEQLIADILDVQRIMAGKLRLEPRSIDLGDIVRAAAETVQPSADAKNIKLQLLRDLNVTPIWGDSDRLQQVTWNLLSNAIKFTPNGGRVQVRLQQSEDECEMVVEDNGPGIAPDFLPYVFERFRQADSSSTRTHKGLGLGLAIVRNLVEMHGGSITVSNVSEPGRTGAVFTIKLPRRAARPAAAVAGDLESAASGDRPAWLDEGPSLSDLRVLVVDDDPDARELIGTILERYGAAVALAASAEEGMQALTNGAPHVIITDIEMPQEDGYAFIRRVRALPPDAGGKLPAAALTAYASVADRMKVLAAGFNMHVAKPVQPAELAMVVASLAGRQAEATEATGKT